MPYVMAAAGFEQAFSILAAIRHMFSTPMSHASEYTGHPARILEPMTRPVNPHPPSPRGQLGSGGRAFQLATTQPPPATDARRCLPPDHIHLS